jgi:trk system potassium uptake protein TrkA
MEHINYDSLLILCLLAFITPIFINSFKKIKLPFVVGEIFVGIIVGKSFLNLIHNDLWIHFLSHLGLAYLMFLSGLEIEFESFTIKEEKSKAFQRIIISLGMFAASIGVSFVITQYLYTIGMVKEVTFITLLFAASAPGLLVPFLKERDILNTEYGQTLLIYSLICEFAVLIALTFVSSTKVHGLSYHNFLFLIVFAAAFILYKLIVKIIDEFDFSTGAFRNLHIGVRAAFALILVLVTISDKFGTEIILGSFLAGIIFTLTTGKGKEELKHELDIIGYGFLIPIFFIMVGVNLELSAIFKDPEAIMKIPIFLIIIFLVKLIPSIFMVKNYGVNKAFAGAFILSSQLSLLIVGAQMAFQMNIINSASYSSFILTTVISGMLFPLLFDKIFKYDGIEKMNRISAVDKICIREIILMNENLYNKQLKEIDFPHGCRVFLIVRDDIEILPEGDTRILEGDRLILVGLSEKVDDVITELNEIT